jgi:hypothetical protein
MVNPLGHHEQTHFLNNGRVPFETNHNELFHRSLRLEDRPNERTLVLCRCGILDQGHFWSKHGRIISKTQATHCPTKTQAFSSLNFATSTSSQKKEFMKAINFTQCPCNAVTRHWANKSPVLKAQPPVEIRPVSPLQKASKS